MGAPRHKMPPHIWTADVLDLSMRQITPLAGLAWSVPPVVEGTV